MRHIPAHRSFPILKALRLHQTSKFFGFGAVGYNHVINIITIRSVGKREEAIESYGKYPGYPIRAFWTIFFL